MSLLAQPRWVQAAQALVEGCIDLPNEEDRVALLVAVCDGLGDELYPAFLRLLWSIGRFGDHAACAAVADTLVHALRTGRMPSGRRNAWGADSSSLAATTYRSTRNLGPLEYLCAWHAQAVPERALTAEQFHAAARSLMDLIATSSEARALYCEKLQLVEPDEAESEAMLWGTILEPAIRAEYERRTERRVLYESPFRILRSRLHPFMTATLDGVLPDGGERGPGVLECKTASAFLAEQWADEPPLAYQVQIQHAMHVAEVRWGALVVLLGGQRLVAFDVERNDAFLALLIPRLEAFWHRLERQEPPPIEAASAEILRALYPVEVPGKVVQLPEAAGQWAATRERAAVQVKKWEAIKLGAEAQLKAAIGDAERGVLPDGSAYTWKASSRAEYTVKATTVRTLRRQEVKG